MGLGVVDITSRNRKFLNLLSCTHFVVFSSGSLCVVGIPREYRYRVLGGLRREVYSEQLLTTRTFLDIRMFLRL